MINVTKIRKDFLILDRKVNGKPLAYLDSAATSLRPRQVLSAVSDYYEKFNANVHRGIHSLTQEATDAYEGARERIANFVGVRDTGEIIFVRNTDEAINLVAYSWGRANISNGDEIVLTIAEHHANFVPWQQLVKERGASLKIVPIDEEGQLDLNAFKKALSKKTKLVTFFHVSNVLGTINPVEEMVKIVRSTIHPSPLILIDGAQAVPHMPVDIPKIDCDFYAFSGHKMLGPTGIGVLWGRREILEEMAPFEMGGDMISRVSIEQSFWNELPWKFEAGTPNIEGAIGFGAAVDYLEKIGIDNVRKHEIELTKYILKKLQKIDGIRILGPKDFQKRCGVVAFNLDDVPPHDVASILDGEGIEIRSGYNCAEPLMTYLGMGQVARVSFYIYNTKAEVNKFMDALQIAKKTFRLSIKKTQEMPVLAHEFKT